MASRPPGATSCEPASRNSAAVSTYAAAAEPNRARSAAASRPRPGGPLAQLPLEGRVPDQHVEAPGPGRGPGAGTGQERVPHHEVAGSRRGPPGPQGDGRLGHRDGQRVEIRAPQQIPGHDGDRHPCRHQAPAGRDQQRPCAARRVHDHGATTGIAVGQRPGGGPVGQRGRREVGPPPPLRGREPGLQRCPQVAGGVRGGHGGDRGTTAHERPQPQLRGQLDPGARGQPARHPGHGQRAVVGRHRPTVPSRRVPGGLSWGRRHRYGRAGARRRPPGHPRPARRRPRGPSHGGGRLRRPLHLRGPARSVPAARPGRGGHRAHGAHDGRTPQLLYANRGAKVAVLAALRTPVRRAARHRYSHRQQGKVKGATTAGGVVGVATPGCGRPAADTALQLATIRAL